MEASIGRKKAALKLLISAGFVVAAIAVLLAWQQPTEERAEAASTGPEIDMVVSSGTTGCPGGTPGDHICVPTSGSLTLTISAIGIPAGGYIGVQTFVVFGPDLTYNITGAPTDEVVWPDCENVATVRSQFSPESVNHGCLTGLLTFPVSTYIGDLVELSFTCSAAFTSTELELLPAGDPFASSSGSGFAPAGGGGTIAAKVSNLTVDCVEPTPTPTPTDTPTVTPTPPPTDTPTPCPTECPPSGVTTLLSSSVPADTGEFGTTVAVGGDIAVVGSWREDDAGNNAGVVYVFQRDEGVADSWGEARKLTASDSEDYYHLGHSVALDGDTLIAGATHAKVENIDVGGVYVFERDEGGADNWGEVKKLTASDPEYNDVFGWSVAISGDVAVVGAFGEDTRGEWAGAAYIFHRDQGGTDNWGQVKKLLPADVRAGDNFGYHVAVSGDTAMVRSRSGGFVHVFERNWIIPDSWGEVHKIPVPKGDSGIALSGDTAILGANRAPSGFGTAVIHKRDQGGTNAWGTVKTLTPSVPIAGAFGGRVAIDGEIAVVGSLVRPWWQDATTPGAAYIYQRDAGGADNWGEVNRLTAPDPQPDDDFGSDVALSGDIAIVGASLDNPGNPHPGAAYIFQPKLIPTPTPTPTQTPTPKMPDADTDGDGIPNSIDPDDDNDGCSDDREIGPDERLGGRRSPHDPWDFYDVAIGGGAPGRDGQVDLFNDVVGVIDHYAPSGLEPEYDVWYDRGPTAGPNPWNLTAPDGVIDLFNDIVGVVAQAFHDCR